MQAMALGVVAEFHFDHLLVVDHDPVVDARDQLRALPLASFYPGRLQVAQEADDVATVGERRRGRRWDGEGIQLGVESRVFGEIRLGRDPPRGMVGCSFRQVPLDRPALQRRVDRYRFACPLNETSHRRIVDVQLR